MASASVTPVKRSWHDIFFGGYMPASVVSNWRVFLKKPIGIFVFYFKYTINFRGPVAHSFYIYKYESSFENNKCND